MHLQTKTVPSWVIKALVQKALAAARLVGMYHCLQRWFGRLRQFHPRTRIEYAAKLYHDVQPVVPICDAKIVEVGTGWVPIVPIGLYLIGARSIDTYDLFRHMQMDITLQSVWQYKDCLEDLHQRTGISLDYIQSRYESIQHVTQIDNLFEICGIRYHAPCNFVQSGLDTASVNIFYTNLVLEHLPSSILEEIHREAFRVLNDDGVCWHNVDCTDHYSHADPSISPINFLKYGEKQWARWGQNDIVYQNRMRITQYYEIFKKLGFEIVNDLKYTSDEVCQVLKRNFPLHRDFANLSTDDIATTAFRVVLKKKQSVLRHAYLTPA
ncbi:MAG: hypothetical protein ACYC9J_13875 [Sulfuricaulis sp.]